MDVSILGVRIGYLPVLKVSIFCPLRNGKVYFPQSWGKLFQTSSINIPVPSCPESGDQLKLFFCLVIRKVSIVAF
jgi:hypothetical protein